MNTIEETIDTAPYMTEQKQLKEKCHANHSDDNTSEDKTEKADSQSEQIIQNRCEEQKLSTGIDSVNVRIEMVRNRINLNA